MAIVSEPTHAWTLLLQSVLVGRAQEAYSALSTEDSKDYEKVKGAILRTYELVPEAYRKKTVLISSDVERKDSIVLDLV